MSQDPLLLLIQVSFGKLSKRRLVGLVRMPEERLEVLLGGERKRPGQRLLDTRLEVDRWLTWRSSCQIGSS
jgi:hypothetical protein